MTLYVKHENDYFPAPPEMVLAEAQAHYVASIRPGQSITRSRDAANFLEFNFDLKNLKHEIFIVIFLDTNHKIICCEEIFRGTIDRNSVYPREVAKKVLEYNAKAVIFGHNHPSGSTKPSQDDINITEKLIEALILFEVTVLDHLIIGDTVVSMMDIGLMPH